MNTPLGLLGTPHIGFFALLIIGGLAGWIAGMITGMRHGIFTNILIGIAGSWIGSRLAEMLGVIVDGTVGHLLAAIAGSVIVTVIWAALHRRNAPMA